MKWYVVDVLCVLQYHMLFETIKLGSSTHTIHTHNILLYDTVGI